MKYCTITRVAGFEVPGFFNYADFYRTKGAKYAGGTLVELGATVLMLAESSSGSTVYTMDTRPPPVPPMIDKVLRHFSIDDGCAALRKNIAASKLPVTFLHEDSTEAAKLFEDGTVDFVFVGVNDSNDSVLQDTRARLPKVRVGGTIAGHDYFPNNRKHGGVARTVDEALESIREEGNSVWMYSV